MQEHLNDRFAALRGLLAEPPSRQHATTLQKLFTGWPHDDSLSIALEYAAQHMTSRELAPPDEESQLSEHELLGPDNRYVLLTELPPESMAWTSLRTICEDHLAWDRRQSRLCIIRKYNPYFTVPSARSIVEEPIKHADQCAKSGASHIMPLLDASFDDTQSYVVMPHIFGPNLQQIMPKLRKESTPEERDILPLAIALQLLEALDATHNHTDDLGLGRPLYHTRLTPSSVRLSEMGNCYLHNFGLEQAVVSSSHSSNSRQPMGYYAPEQFQDGDVITAATDIFHMGILLYELLAHRHPYQGKTELHILRKLYEGQYTPIQQVLPSLPAALADLVDCALAHNPEDRYQSAADMKQALQEHYDTLTDQSTEAHLSAFLQRTCAVEALLTRYGCLLACQQQGALSFYWTESRPEPLIEPFPPLSYDNAYSRTDSIGAREIGRGRPLGISNLFSGIWRMLRRQN